jgi:hypothetical protein
MAWGRKTGGRDFACGYGPRRQLHRGASKEVHKLRRDLINYYADHCADALLDVLERRGLIPELVERYSTRERRDPRLGGPRWKRA